jgi:hypothetical protein
MLRNVRAQRFSLKARLHAKHRATIILLRMLHIHAQWYSAARGFYDLGVRRLP